MNIYTHYSSSHQEMYECYFKPSLRKLYTKEEVNIFGVKHDQTTKNGTFMEHGWLDSMDIKLDLILLALEKEERFIFADCDIQFFKPFICILEDKLKYHDLICQEDRDSLCAGFFACNSNESTKKLFKEIKNNFRNMVNDQEALNRLKHLVNYSMLDKKQFFTIGNFFTNKNGTFVWDNESIIRPPKEIVMHHANYVVGTRNKLKLMEMVKNEAMV